MSSESTTGKFKPNMGSGDNGTTFAMAHGRVGKDSLVVHLVGDLDELNSWVGYIHQQYAVDTDRIQKALFAFGASVVTFKDVPGPAELEYLVGLIAEADKALPPLKNFILPQYPAEVHVARGVCRRAERNAHAYHRLVSVPTCSQELAVGIPELAIYLNRLSDYLFLLARAICIQNGREEKLWD